MPEMVGRGEKHQFDVRNPEDIVAAFELLQGNMEMLSAVINVILVRLEILESPDVVGHKRADLAKSSGTAETSASN